MMNLSGGLPFLYLAKEMFSYNCVVESFFLYNYKFFFYKKVKNIFIVILGIHALIIYFALCL